VKPLEHYREAERLLADAAVPVIITVPRTVTDLEAENLREKFVRAAGGDATKVIVQPDDMTIDVSAMLAAAQVHATLALAGSQMIAAGVWDDV
jgi:hypothetical protein